jgi:hypothetical protein
VKDNYVAKNLHKANNRYAVHENKRESLLADAMDKELDETAFIGLKCQGNEEFSLTDIGTSSISISDEED